MIGAEKALVIGIFVLINSFKKNYSYLVDYHGKEKRKQILLKHFSGSIAGSGGSAYFFDGDLVGRTKDALSSLVILVTVNFAVWLHVKCKMHDSVFY